MVVSGCARGHCRVAVASSHANGWHRKFERQVIKAKESGTQPPVVNIDGSSFFYCRHKNIFLVAVTRLNANACMTGRERNGTRTRCRRPGRPCFRPTTRATPSLPQRPQAAISRRTVWFLYWACWWPGLVFQFLFALNTVFEGYFGEEYDEEAIRNSFTLVYELLDGACRVHGRSGTVAYARVLRVVSVRWRGDPERLRLWTA